MTDIVEAHRRAVDVFGGHVSAAGDADWNRPTPCADWDVRQLVNHLVYEDRWAVPLFAGRSVAEVGEEFDGDLVGDDPVGAWRSAAEAALSVAAQSGAVARPVSVSWGQITGAEYLEQLFGDHLVHAWDLARGLGREPQLPEDLVALCYELIAPQEEALKASGAYGTRVEVPADADVLTRLLAVTGRRADWSP